MARQQALTTQFSRTATPRGGTVAGDEGGENIGTTGRKIWRRTTPAVLTTKICASAHATRWRSWSGDLATTLLQTEACVTCTACPHPDAYDPFLSVTWCWCPWSMPSPRPVKSRSHSLSTWRASRFRSLRLTHAPMGRPCGEATV